MLAVLERETAVHHADAEADLFRILDDPRPSAFARFLAAIYQFEHAVEARVARVEGVSLRFAMERTKTGRLEEDLLALGIGRGSCDAVAGRPQLPRLSTVPETLGWLYVVERNTLHHGALYRALAPRLRDTLRIAGRYLTTYRCNVYERWTDLGAYIDRATTSPDIVQEVIAAADEAFACQRLWFHDVLAPVATRMPAYGLR